MRIKRTLGFIGFFIGWVLSPFTWWNDIFINIPLSYILASFFFYFIRIPLSILLISAYIFTNVLGLLLMYWGGKYFTKPAQDKIEAIKILIIAVIIFSLIVYYIDRKGMLVPLGEFLRPLKLK